MDKESKFLKSLTERRGQGKREKKEGREGVEERKREKMKEEKRIE